MSYEHILLALQSFNASVMFPCLDLSYLLDYFPFFCVCMCVYTHVDARAFMYEYGCQRITSDAVPQATG